MKNKYVFVCVLLLSILLVSVGFTNIYVSKTTQVEDENFVVVTSFYPMYIASMNVVGNIEGVTLKNLSEPQTGCLHDFQLTPEDMKLLSTADVFIINGGGIESFMEEIALQYPDLLVIEACDGIELLTEEDEEHGHSHDHASEEEHEEEEMHDHNHDVNAHAWLSIACYRQQIETIAEGLAAAREEYAQEFFAHAKIYDEKLEILQKEEDAISELLQGEEVIIFHQAYAYLTDELGLHTAFCMDLDEERQISAGEVAQVLKEIQNHGIHYIFAEELYGADMCEMIQKETDAEVIYLDTLNRGVYEADSYIDGMKANLELIKSAFCQ